MWNGLNTADRQQERRQRLLAAGVEIIGTHGVQSVNVRAICQAAANHALAQRGREVAFAMLQFCLAQTTPPHNNTSSPYDAATMEVTATVLVTGVWGLLLAWRGDGLAVAISRDDLVDQIVALILRALPT